MTNYDILNLVNNGVLGITAHDVAAKDAYKVFKFRKELQKAIENLIQSENELFKEAGIDNPDSFDRRMDELESIESPTDQEKKELEDNREKLKRFNELRAALYETEVVLDVKTLPYDQWHILQNENKEVDIVDENGESRKMDVLSGTAETVLENILWRKPDDE